LTSRGSPLLFSRKFLMIRLALFDIDGTLIRTGGAGMRAFARVFSLEFKAVDGFERLKFAGRTDYSIVREFFTAHNIPVTPENFTRFFDRYVFWLEQIIREAEVQICAGVLELIHQLETLPQPPVLGLLTGNIRLGAEIKLRKAGLWDWFQIGGYADDHEDRDRIAAAALERGNRLLGKTLTGEQVLVVGDTPHDIRCGRAIGAKVLAVATGGATLEELTKHRPDWAVVSLREFSVKQLVSQ
jgi:phosphoglycolate phosphatase